MSLALAVAIPAGLFATAPLAAQSQQMEQKVMAIKEAQAANKQKLAQYTWTETETIAIKGDVVRLLTSLPPRGEVAFHVAQPQGVALDGHYALPAFSTVLTRLAAPCKWSLRNP